MSKWYAKLFHFLGFLECMYALEIYHRYTGILPITYGGKWKYLTYINLNVKALCFSLFVLDDVLGYLCRSAPSLQGMKDSVCKFKSVFYTTVALPASMMVFVMFWSLFLIDRELVYPKSFDQHFPSWANHLWHSTILTVLLEAACIKHPYPSKTTSLIITNTGGLLYLVWILWVEKVGGVVIYPFLAQLHGFEFVLFVLTEFAFIQLLFNFGKLLNHLSGGTTNHKLETTKKAT
uniref:Androgen-induced gene 1 protein-like n=1 Tax=Phallusia mammillata TaxID=59560 RepID=A0A6F9D5X7_9ASCI|nr:androgen-induced gene 1 protein-like [Phallusia mammillata]